jgi:hypothetical protein
VAAEEKLAWKIRWRSVNKPIDDDLFDWKDFGAPDDVTIIDSTQGRPVVIRRGADSKPGRGVGIGAE